MIISHKHKFIFIKTRKTAGTSIEMALEEICGSEDVITPDIAKSRRSAPGASDVLISRARNYNGVFNPFVELPMASSALDVARISRDFLRWPKYYNHMRGYSVKSRVDSKVWNNYYKFCFERNPWDKVISFYYWFNRGNNNALSIGDFIRLGGTAQTMDRSLPTDWSRYTLNNQLILDDVYCFDSLSLGLKTALKRAGVDDKVIQSVKIPQLKTKIRNHNANFSFDDASNEVVKNVFHNEIEKFGYFMPERFK
jgi:hypothetical protein